jgi:cytochrome P450 family 114
MTTTSDTDSPTAETSYLDTSDSNGSAAADRVSGGEDLYAVLGDARVQEEGFWALCDWLRRNDPVHHTDTGFTIVSRHRDVVRVLTDETVLVPDVDTMSQAFQGAIKHRALHMAFNNMGTTNPPGHARLKRLASVGFTPRAIQAAAASVRELCAARVAQLEEALRDGETVDLYGPFAERLGVDVISSLVGVPVEDRPWMGRLVKSMLAFADPAVGAAGLAEADEAVNALEDYFTPLVEERRRDPRPDLISAWSVQPDGDEDRLDTDEVLSLLWLVWMAGFETTAAAICDATVASVKHPEAAACLDGGERGVRAFIDESLRYNPPAVISGVLRVASADLVLEGGEVIPKGSRLTGIIGSANHDPEIYSDPERFDPERGQPPLMSFGRGIHTCLGVPLARMELEIALKLMRNRLPALELAEEPRRRGGLPVRTFSRVMVRAA